MLVLVMAQRGRFARGADRNQPVGALFDLPFDEITEGFLVQRAVCREGRNQRRNRTLELRMLHFINPDQFAAPSTALETRPDHSDGSLCPQALSRRIRARLRPVTMHITTNSRCAERFC